MSGRPAAVLLALVLVVALAAGCAPAARSELPREARGKEVNAERLKALAVADDYLREVTGAAPVAATMDGCRDLRGQHLGYLWRCTVVRAATVTGADPAAALGQQRQRLAEAGCSAFPGLGTTRERLAEGLEPRYLYEVDYHCGDRVLVTIRFSEPADPELSAKLDLGQLQYGPGTGNVVSQVAVAPEVVDRLRADTSQRVIMVVAVIRNYWMMPDPALE